LPPPHAADRMCIGEEGGQGNKPIQNPMGAPHGRVCPSGKKWQSWQKIELEGNAAVGKARGRFQKEKVGPRNKKGLQQKKMEGNNTQPP